MTSLIPYSLRKGLQVSLAVTAATLVGLTGTQASASMPNIKRESKVSITFDLIPPAPVTPDPTTPTTGTDDTTGTGTTTTGTDTTTGTTTDTTTDPGTAPAASGTAEIQLNETRKSDTANLKLDVEGLAAGSYSVDATLIDATTVHLGDFTVAATPTTTTTTTTTTTASVELEKALTIDPRSITELTVSLVATDTTGAQVLTEVLSGTPESDTSYLRFFANVRVTAPPASVLTNPPTPTDDTTDDDVTTSHGNGHGKGKGNGKGKSKGNGKGPKAPGAKKVHGHALVMSSITNGVETKRFFQLIGFGAPGNATLNIVVNGETVGTVTTTKQGQVKLRSLPETVDFGTLDLITLTDANGVAVMQADF